MKRRNHRRGHVEGLKSKTEGMDVAVSRAPPHLSWASKATGLHSVIDWHPYTARSLLPLPATTAAFCSDSANSRDDMHDAASSSALSAEIRCFHPYTHIGSGS